MIRRFYAAKTEPKSVLNHEYLISSVFQEECYRMILARGANHDLVDSNGNSVTHILVVFDNMRMFDLAVECGASINIKNKLNMTPLTVAA